MLKYRVKYRANKWTKIKGVFLPVYMHYGYSVLRFIDNTLEADDVVLELGAGLGFIATFCAKKIGSDKVFTYEANPKLAPLMEEVFEKNKVYPHATQAMLGEAQSSSCFYGADKNFLASSVREGANSSGVEVPVLSLNDTIRDLQPTYLAMDIEGAEAYIMSIIDFQSIRKLQFEMHPWLLIEAEMDSIFKKLRDCGFKKSEAFSFPNNFFFSR